VGSESGSYERKEKQGMKVARKKETQKQANKKGRNKFSASPGPTQDLWIQRGL
jgi:hypothetical protein